MGLRFRKSIKIAPGVKLNFGKKSHSFTFGGKGIHYTVNSKGKRTSSVGIPGTGVSYTKSTGGSTKTRSGGNKVSKKTSDNKGIGCLGFLMIILLIALAVWLYSFCWIIAIPVLIYCLASKKYRAYRKRNSAICIAIIATSLFVFIWLGSPKELNSVYANWEQTSYDILDTAEVEIKPTPSDAKINSLSISENDIAELDYSGDKAIVTFNAPGEVTLYFTANDNVKSNSVTITVTDKAAEEEARKQAELEEQIKAEESKEAQETSVETQIATESQLETEIQTEAQEQQEEMVWIPASGSKYHSKASCSGMENPTQVTKSEAEAMGYTPCKRCH